MRKKLGIIILIIFFGSLAVAIIINYYGPIKISAQHLAEEYSINSQGADKRFLNRNMEVSGTVKAFYKLLNTRNVLELNTNVPNQNLFCFFASQPLEFKAGQLQQGQKITIKGICRGKDAYKFVKGIKIDVVNIILK